jgi:hypothetical protein
MSLNPLETWLGKRLAKRRKKGEILMGYGFLQLYMGDVSVQTWIPF